MANTNSPTKARAIGINHIALEVGNIGEALAFYSSFLDFDIKSKTEEAAFIYFGDQFINFARNDERTKDQMRHFGIAVDDKELVRRTLIEMGVQVTPGKFLDFHDPWGNLVEITTYVNIQFSKSDRILNGMGLAHLSKTDEAISELHAKGLAD